jgi:excisionase family DNA binding protein
MKYSPSGTHARYLYQRQDTRGESNDTRSHRSLDPQDQHQQRHHGPASVGRGRYQAQHVERAGRSVTTAEAAASLGISPRRVRRLCEKGQLEAVRVGRDWQIQEDSVQRRLEERTGR